MTILAAVYRSKTDYALAADSAVAANDGILMPARKVHRFGPGLVGFAGADVVSQRWRRALDAVDAELPRLLRAGACSRLVEAAVVAMHDAVQPTTGPTGAGEYPRTGGCLVVVWPGGILSMDSFGCVYHHQGYWCEGTGGPIALGYLDALTDVRDNPTELFEADVAPAPTSAGEDAVRAVKAAIRRVTSCRGPVCVMEGPE